VIRTRSRSYLAGLMILTFERDGHRSTCSARNEHAARALLKVYRLSGWHLHSVRVVS
jgi:hypothetical protein